jgi:exonuclease III
MRALIWNFRGFGSKDWKRQLREFLRKEEVDIIGLQETIRQTFSKEELNGLIVSKVFTWCWLPVVGHSGGVLLGVDSDRYEVLAKELGGFFVSMTLLQKDINASWECLVVYGPVQHRESQLFLRDLDAKLCWVCCPIMIVGDFNLIRSTEDKNNTNIDIGLMNLFNDFIAHHHLN